MIFVFKSIMHETKSIRLDKVVQFIFIQQKPILSLLHNKYHLRLFYSDQEEPINGWKCVCVYVHIIIMCFLFLHIPKIELTCICFMHCHDIMKPNNFLCPTKINPNVPCHMRCLKFKNFVTWIFFKYFEAFPNPYPSFRSKISYPFGKNLLNPKIKSPWSLRISSIFATTTPTSILQMNKR